MPSPAPAPTTPRRLAAVVVGVLAALVLAELALRVTGVGADPAVKCRLRREDASTSEVVYHCYPSNPWNEFQPPPDVSRGNWRLTKLTVPTVDLPLTDLAKAAGLPVLDLAPVFAGRETTSLQVHPNGRAHEIAAKTVAPWIIAEPSLR